MGYWIKGTVLFLGTTTVSLPLLGLFILGGAVVGVIIYEIWPFSSP